LNRNEVDELKKLYRSRSDARIAGVLGGLGEYFEVDPTLIRLAFVVLAVASFGAAIIGYFLAVLLIPKAPWTQAPSGGQMPTQIPGN
jgi:phage shock protein C